MLFKYCLTCKVSECQTPPYIANKNKKKTSGNWNNE